MVFLELLNKNFFEWDNRMEFAYCKVLKREGSVLQTKDVDVFFVEGAISTDDEEKKLRHIRNISKYVVAVGSCACTGMPSAQRNLFDKAMQAEIEERLLKHNLRKNVEPINKFIKVDDYVMGCPMGEEIFVKTLNKYFTLFGV